MCFRFFVLPFLHLRFFFPPNSFYPHLHFFSRIIIPHRYSGAVAKGDSFACIPFYSWCITALLGGKVRTVGAGVHTHKKKKESTPHFFLVPDRGGGGGIQKYIFLKTEKKQTNRFCVISVKNSNPLRPGSVFFCFRFFVFCLPLVGV